MGTGMILGGKKYLVPGVEVVNWQDDPAVAPRITDFSPRKARISRCIIHVFDPHRTELLPGAGPPEPGVWAAKYQIHELRDVSWDATMGTDGRLLWQSDPIVRFTWHAMAENPTSLAIMLAQRHGALYEAQVRNTVAALNALAALLEFPKQVPAHSMSGIVVPCTSLAGSLVMGTVGHCNVDKRPRLRGERAEGIILRALLEDGWTPVVVPAA